MSSIINNEDEIWNIFLGYLKLLVDEAPNTPTPSRFHSDIAKDLTIAHMLNHVTCSLTDLKEQQAAFERTKYYIKPETFVQRSPELEEKQVLPNAKI